MSIVFRFQPWFSVANGGRNYHRWHVNWKTMRTLYIIDVFKISYVFCEGYILSKNAVTKDKLLFMNFTMEHKLLILCLDNARPLFMVYLIFFWYYILTRFLFLVHIVIFFAGGQSLFAALLFAYWLHVTGFGYVHYWWIILLVNVSAVIENLNKFWLQDVELTIYYSPTFFIYSI